MKAFCLILLTIDNIAIYTSTLCVSNNKIIQLKCQYLLAYIDILM